MKPRIAVIGGGCSAILFAAHFYLQNRGQANVTLYDRSGIFGRGIAYSTQRREHLLNVRAADMSGIANDSEHFVKWLKEKNHPYTETDFVPRMVYAEYLQSLLQASLTSARAKGCGLELEGTEVSGVSRRADKFILQTGKGETEADAVVLATGNSQ